MLLNENGVDSMAHLIADETGGDIVRVTAKEAYPDDYDATVDRAKKERDDNAKPEIAVDLTEEQIAEYFRKHEYAHRR